MSDELEIRPARLGEAAEIANLSRLIVEDGLPWSWTPERVARAIRNPDVEVAVVRWQNRVVAFAVLELGQDEAHLLLFGVTPRFQRRGLGRRLIEWTQTLAKNAGIFTMLLEVRAVNERARQFYRALGYVEVELRRGFYSGIEDAIIMVHDLVVIGAR